MVNLTWSLTDGGAAISSVTDLGDIANGASSTAKTIFIRHDGSNNITDVGLYLRQFSGTYSGDFTASGDFARVIGWGDETTSAAFGGVAVNFRADVSYASGWATYDDKTPTGGFVHKTDTGDSESNSVTIPTYTGATADGEIQTGSSPGVEFQVKVIVPSNESNLGIRQFEHVIHYTYTS